MSKQDDGQHGERILGAVTYAQTGRTLMIGHICGQAGGINIVTGRRGEEPDIVVVDADTARDIIGWLQEAVTLATRCPARWN